MNTILIAGFTALSALVLMALKLYWMGLPSVCQ